MAAFRKALRAETGLGWNGGYDPLNRSPFYYPHTKKRHRISAAHRRALRPSRWKLPVAEDVWGRVGMITPWAVYYTPKNRVRLLTDAIAKIHDGRDELLTADARRKLWP